MLRRMGRLLRGNKNTQLVAMLHTGRCGSTVLGNMLHSHRQVHWASEIFERYMGGGFEGRGGDLLKQTVLTGRESCRSAIYGFEIKYLSPQHLSEQCLNMSVEELVHALQDLGVSRFIVLGRRNYLRRAISAEVGRVKGEWHSKKEASPTQVDVDVDSYKIGNQRKPLLEFFESMDDEFARLKSTLPDQALFLTYEDDVQDDPRVGYAKVCAFLGVDAGEPEISLRRTNPFAYEQMVRNFEDVKTTLHGTRYGWMLNE